MSKPSSGRRPPASRPKTARTPALYTARQRELNTKRRGELAELAFTLKAASLGFGVSRPFGDSERYDAIVDARELAPPPNRRCRPTCPILQVRRKDSRKPEAQSPKPTCPALHPIRVSDTVPPGCPITRSHIVRGSGIFPPLWRVQVKCSTQIDNGLFHLNAYRRTGCRAVPYLPGEIDFLAAYIIPEDTWYIIPLEAFLGSTSLLFRRRSDSKPGLYDQYKEAWHLLRKP